MATSMIKQVLMNESSQAISPITLAETVYYNTTTNVKQKIDQIASGSGGGGVSYYEWTTIGDSLTSGVGSWVATANNVLNIPICTNIARSGNLLHGSNGMIQQAELVTTTTDLCTIMGGTNDMKWFDGSMGTPKEKGEFGGTLGSRDMNTYIGSYQEIVETLLTKNPKMKIILLTSPRAFETDRTFLTTINDWTKEVAAYYGLPVIDTYNLAGFNEFNKSSFYADNLHFNQDGHSRLGKTVAYQIRST